MTMVMDLPFYPNADKPTHIEIPHAGLRFDTAPVRRRVSVFLPLDDDGNITVVNGVTGKTMLTVDVINGISVAPGNKLFSDGFETAQTALRWFRELRN